MKFETIEISGSLEIVIFVFKSLIGDHNKCLVGF